MNRFSIKDTERPVFVKCNLCDCDINVGDTVYAISWTREIIISLAETQPTTGKMSLAYCETCAGTVDFESISVKAAVNPASQIN